MDLCAHTLLGALWEDNQVRGYHTQISKREVDRLRERERYQNVYFLRTVSFIIISPLGPFFTLPPQPTSVLLTFVVFLMRNLALVIQMPAQSKSSVVLIQHIQELPKLSSDTRTLNVILGHFIMTSNYILYSSSVLRSYTLKT